MASKFKSSRIKPLFYGFLAWTFWIVFYTIVFKFQADIHWGGAFIASANTYYIYAILSIGIWLVCKRIPFDRFPLFMLIGIHFFLSIFVSVLWLSMMYGLWYLAEGEIIFEVIGFRSIIGWQFLFGVITYLLIAGLFYTIIYYRQFREKELKEAELKLLTRDAEFKALKMQINPHFLFNALNSINALVTQDPKEARSVIGQLSDLLRISLETREKRLAPLEEELAFVHLYLDIERVRFGDRMKYEERIDDSLLSLPFPTMVLQPLIENAVKHGIAEKRGKGKITLEIGRRMDRVECFVSNTVSHARGIKRSSASNGTGLENLRRRLDLLYGAEYSYYAGLKDRIVYEATLSFPEKYDGSD